MDRKTEAMFDLLAGARHWPTISEVADATGVSGRRIRQAVADGEVAAVKVNVLRVNPASFAQWAERRQ